MSYAFLCEKCNGRAQWRVTRIGDVVTTWACNDHLARVCLALQRTRETQLQITMNERHPALPEQGETHVG